MLCLILFVFAEVINHTRQLRQTSLSAYSSCKATDCCVRCREDDAIQRAQMRRQWERETGRCGPGAAGDEWTPTTTTTKYWSAGCTRGRCVNARVSDNYYQTGCVARPDVQISRRMRTPAHPPAAAAHPFRQRTDETRRVVRPSVKATTPATCISCCCCWCCCVYVTLRYPVMYVWSDVYMRGDSRLGDARKRRRGLSQLLKSRFLLCRLYLCALLLTAYILLLNLTEQPVNAHQDHLRLPQWSNSVCWCLFQLATIATAFTDITNTNTPQWPAASKPSMQRTRVQTETFSFFSLQSVGVCSIL